MKDKNKTNIKEEVVQGHRFGKKLTNSDYGTVAFLLSRNDILSDKKANANNSKIAPMHGQTQAFWSADKRNGREAVENRTA